MSTLDPKEFTKKAFGSSGKYITEVLNRYWKHINYYKNEKTPKTDSVKEAEDLFGAKAV